MKIAVVIPAYNEEKRISTVLEKLPSALFGHSLLAIVVDDGSADSTSAKAKAYPGVVVLRHQTNLGKGAAAKTGCDAAYHLGYDYIVLMDADGQHNPENLPDLLRPLIEGETELVLGARPLNYAMPLMMRVGNKSITYASRLLFGIHTKDSQSGYRAFKSEIYPRIRWVASNYAMETEMLILSAFSHVKITEVSVPTVYHDGYKGTTVVDGLNIMKTMLKWRVFASRQLKLKEALALPSADMVDVDMANLIS